MRNGRGLNGVKLQTTRECDGFCRADLAFRVFKGLSHVQTRLAFPTNTHVLVNTTLPWPYSLQYFLSYTISYSYVILTQVFDSADCATSSRGVPDSLFHLRVDINIMHIAGKMLGLINAGIYVYYPHELIIIGRYLKLDFFCKLINQ